MTAAPRAARWRAAPIRTVVHGAARSMAAIVAPMMQRIHWDLHLVEVDDTAPERGAYVRDGRRAGRTGISCGSRS